MVVTLLSSCLDWSPLKLIDMAVDPGGGPDYPLNCCVSAWHQRGDHVPWTQIWNMCSIIIQYITKSFTYDLLISHVLFALHFQ